MRFKGGQESSARGSPYPGRGGHRYGIAGKGKYYGTEQGNGRLEDRDLQHTASLAFLARLAGFAMFARAFHIVAAVHPHVVHHRHAHRLHRARFCRRLNARHPAEGKRQANQEDEAKPQEAFHGMECSRRKLLLQLGTWHKWLVVRHRLDDNTALELNRHYEHSTEARGRLFQVPVQPNQFTWVDDSCLL